MEKGLEKWDLFEKEKDWLKKVRWDQLEEEMDKGWEKWEGLGDKWDQQEREDWVLLEKRGVDKWGETTQEKES